MKISFLESRFSLFMTVILTLIAAIPERSNALVKMDINQGNTDPMPVAIGYFDGQSKENKKMGQEIREVIINDLESSGLFRSIDENAFIDRPSFARKPNFANWRKINATVLAVGNIEETSANSVTVTFNLWDPYGEQSIEKVAFKTTKRSWRRIAHKIADRIYNHLTGEGPYFDSRIVFISESGPPLRRIKKLTIMDQDSANLRYLTDGRELALMPRFDPSSHRVAYLAFHNKRVKVYLLDLHTGLSSLVGRYSGLSFAPCFSPDGKNLAMSIANNGTTTIYEVNLQTGSTRRLTHDLGTISTSPSYSPDGKRIVFNSDRAGSSQLYVMGRDGSNIQRISRGEGAYSTPVWSPRGDYIAFTKQYNRKFYIGVMSPDGSRERLITSSWLEEGPTWSPNGRVIMFYRRSPSGDNRLYTIDITGNNEREIKTPNAASDPAWSTLLSAN